MSRNLPEVRLLPLRYTREVGLLPALFAALFLFGSPARSQPTWHGSIDRELPSLIEIYQHLHGHPEISYQEEKTSAFVARELRRLGFEVSERVGKYPEPDRVSYGVVAVLKNGKGPTVLIRTDLDALPVEEKTGLPYASKAKTKNDSGVEVPVMHACGHDMHMSIFLGTARMLSQMKDRWQGTLLMIGQPSEEVGAGAKALLNDGLYTRSPKPDYALALHCSPSLATGSVGVREGYLMASVTSVDLIIRGVGGHGAYPQMTKDPVVIASQIVLALQTIVSRENSPLDPAVVTVGSIHGGTKHNIIPDDVRLQITVRAYKEEVRRQILNSIERIAKGIALAAGIPADRAPIMMVDDREWTRATYNNPAFARKVRGIVQNALGSKNVLDVEPAMVGEDFGYYGLEDEIPLCMFWLGTVEPDVLEAHRRNGTSPPSVHSSLFAPTPEPTLRTGIKAMTSIVLELATK